MVRGVVVHPKVILNLNLRHLVVIVRTAVVPLHVPVVSLHVVILVYRVGNQFLDNVEIVLEDVIQDVQDVVVVAVVVVSNVHMDAEPHAVRHAVEVVINPAILHHNKMNERIDIKNG